MDVDDLVTREISVKIIFMMYFTETRGKGRLDKTQLLNMTG